MNKDPMFEPPPRPWKVAYGAIYNADESIRIALADRDNSLLPTQRDAVIAHAVKCVNEYERLLELANLSDEHLGVKEVEGEELCLFHRLQSQFAGLLQAYLKARERIAELEEALKNLADAANGALSHEHIQAYLPYEPNDPVFLALLNSVRAAQALERKDKHD